MIHLLQPLPGYPGLHAAWTPERPYFEQAYRVDAGTVARVRFTPVVDEPAELGANIPAMPRNLGMFASASLVDDAGQVIVENGRGLLRAAVSFVAPRVGYDEPAFLLGAAIERVEDLLAFRAQVTGSRLLPPPIPA